MPRVDGIRLTLLVFAILPSFLAIAAAAGPPEHAGADKVEVRGLIKPQNEAAISSQIGGRIVKLPFEPGDDFASGDVMVEFDCAMHRARHDAAAAELAAKNAIHRNNRKLERLDAVSQLEVEISAAEVKRAKAELAIAGVEVSRCVIRAPYDGRVVSTAVNAFETVSPNQELLRILDSKHLEIELIVPSRWLTWLQRDVEMGFRVDETGREYRAHVSQVGASADPVSQTVRLQAVFRSDASDVVAGMSGTANFSMPAAPAP